MSENVLTGNEIYSGTLPSPGSMVIGSAIQLKSISLFSVVNNIETSPFFGSKIARAAGVGAVLIGRSNNRGNLKLSSG